MAIEDYPERFRPAWNPASERPGDPGPFWVWDPGLGNEHEGYGMVTVAYWSAMRGAFVDRYAGNSRVVAATHWAYLPLVEDPDGVKPTPGPPGSEARAERDA